MRIKKKNWFPLYILESKYEKGVYFGYRDKQLNYVTKNLICAATFWTKKEAKKYNKTFLHGMYKVKLRDEGKIWKDE